MRKKSILQKVRQNKLVRQFLFILYVLIIVAVFVNLANIQYPLFNFFNSVYSDVNTPTEYKFYQTYPPSISGIEVGNASQTIILQISISADTKIMENTPVIIEAEGGVGSAFAENTSYIYVGFYGAEYYGHPTTINGYDLWTGFAGVALNKNGVPESMMTFIPEGGTVFGGSNSKICWRTAGDKPLSIGLSWKYAPAGHFIHTYDYSTIHVYSFEDVRATQIAHAEIIAVFGALLFAVFDVYPSIKGRKN